MRSLKYRPCVDGSVVDPLETFGEIYGTAESKRRFVESDFTCPFYTEIPDGVCNKDIKGFGLPARSGICSVMDTHGKGHIICPHRFYEDGYRVLRDIRDFVWGDVPTRAYRSLWLEGSDGGSGYGSLDWFLSKRSDGGDFIGIDVQSNSIRGVGKTGKAIRDLLNDEPGRGYGIVRNASESVTCAMTRLAFKGRLFEGWKRPYVAVMQDALWNLAVISLQIDDTDVYEYHGETFLFFIYSMERKGSKYTLKRTGIKTGRQKTLRVIA